MATTRPTPSARTAGAGRAARSGPSTTSGTCRPKSPTAACPRSERPLNHSQRGLMAVTALAAVTTVDPDAPMARATARGLAPRTRPPRKTTVNRRGRRPAPSSPPAIPAKAGIASDEFQTPRP